MLKSSPQACSSSIDCAISSHRPKLCSHSQCERFHRGLHCLLVFVLISYWVKAITDTHAASARVMKSRALNTRSWFRSLSTAILRSMPTLPKQETHLSRRRTPLKTSTVSYTTRKNQMSMFQAFRDFHIPCNPELRRQSQRLSWHAHNFVYVLISRNLHMLQVLVDLFLENCPFAIPLMMLGICTLPSLSPRINWQASRISGAPSTEQVQDICLTRNPPKKKTELDSTSKSSKDESPVDARSQTAKLALSPYVSKRKSSDHIYTEDIHRSVPV